MRHGNSRLCDPSICARFKSRITKWSRSCQARPGRITRSGDFFRSVSEPLARLAQTKGAGDLSAQYLNQRRRAIILRPGGVVVPIRNGPGAGERPEPLWVCQRGGWHTSINRLTGFCSSLLDRKNPNDQDRCQCSQTADGPTCHVSRFIFARAAHHVGSSRTISPMGHRWLLRYLSGTIAAVAGGSRDVLLQCNKTTTNSFCNGR
jgi:hypothetical protein